MRALVKQGSRVRLITTKPLAPEARQWLAGVEHILLTVPDLQPERLENLGFFANRYCRYWGIKHAEISVVSEYLKKSSADALVATGPDCLPLLSACRGLKRVWYAADNPLLFELSNRGLRSPKTVLLMAAYQWTLSSAADITWVVSEQDRHWGRMSGGKQVDWIPNGVDFDYYSPIASEIEKETCIFWGRLDFAPNILALDYFLDHVWPTLVTMRPECKFIVCGCATNLEIRRKLHETYNVQFREDLPDLRETISRAAVAVFPLVSGAGVKNKVLEAAAMGKAIVASSRCKFGLAGVGIPLSIANSAEDWVSSIIQIWDSDSKRQALEAETLSWVRANHHWSQSAIAALNSIQRNQR
jgi:glycosyltransferase involved in cell wall biosynthesis